MSKIFVGKIATDPAVNNKAADSATIRPIARITPVKIPGMDSLVKRTATNHITILLLQFLKQLHDSF